MGVGRLVGMVNTGASSSESTVIVITTMADSTGRVGGLDGHHEAITPSPHPGTLVLLSLVRDSLPGPGQPSPGRSSGRSGTNQHVSQCQHPPPGSRSDGRCSHRWLQPGRRRRLPPWPRHPPSAIGAIRVAFSSSGVRAKVRGERRSAVPAGERPDRIGMDVATTGFFSSPSPSS